MSTLAPGAVRADDDGPSIDEYCVAFAHPEGVDLPPADVQCYPNFSAALYAALGDPTIALPPDLRPGILTQKFLDTAGGTSTVVSIEYWNRNYNQNPNRAVVYAVPDPNGCRGGDAWQLGYVGNYDNDKYSSARNYGGCDIVRHFQHRGFDGEMDDCSPCADMGGTMNNKTSSLKWKP